MAEMNDEEYYINEGKKCFKNEQFDRAIEFYLKATEINPNNIFSYFPLAFIHETLENFEKAFEYYNKIIEIEPNNSLVYLKRGNLYRILEKYEEAIVDLNKVIFLNNENHKKKDLNKEICPNLSNDNKIIDFYNRLQNLINLKNEFKSEQLILAYYYRGICNMELEDDKTAITDFDKVIKICDDNINLKNEHIDKYIRTFYSRGICKLNCENYKSALYDFNKFIEYDGEDNELYYHRGVCLAVLGQADEAYEDFLKEIEILTNLINNENEDDLYLLRGTCYYSIDKKQEALKDYEKALEIQPNNYAIIEAIKEIKSEIK